MSRTCCGRRFAGEDVGDARHPAPFLGRRVPAVRRGDAEPRPLAEAVLAKGVRRLARGDGGHHQGHPRRAGRRPPSDPRAALGGGRGAPRRTRRREALRRQLGRIAEAAAAAGALAFGPNVGRNVSFVRPDRWLAKWRDLDPLEAIQEVVRRFVHMHGPTRPENFIHWWGRAAAATKRLWRSMEAEFEEVHVEGDRAWVLAADADAIARTKPDRGVRLLPSFDAYLMAFHPRSRLVREDACTGVRES